MKKNTLHYHLTIRGKNVLCAVDYENQLNEYDVTIWCDNRIVGREKLKSLTRPLLSRMLKERFIPTPEIAVKKSAVRA